METKKWKYRKAVLFILIFVGIGLLIQNYDVKTIDTEEQILDSKDVDYKKIRDSYGWAYMVKYEEDGVYYFKLEFDADAPPMIKCSKNDYDKIVSGAYYHVTYKYKGKDYKNAEVTAMFAMDSKNR